MHFVTKYLILKYSKIYILKNVKLAPKKLKQEIKYTFYLTILSSHYNIHNT